MYLSPFLSFVFGAVALVVGAFVFAFAPSRLPATSVIALPPLSKPFWVNETGLLPTGVIVTPALVSLVVGAFGSVPLNSALVRLVNSGFRL